MKTMPQIVNFGTYKFLFISISSSMNKNYFPDIRNSLGLIYLYSGIPTPYAEI